MSTSTAQPRFRYQQVCMDLRRRIASGELAPGQQLPPEDVLAEQYDTTRQTLRRALEVLADEGMILRQKGRGTFVHAQGEAELTEPVLYAGEYRSHFFSDLYLAVVREGQRLGRHVGAWDPTVEHSDRMLRERLQQTAEGGGRVICTGGSWPYLKPLMPPELPPPVFVHVGEVSQPAASYHVAVDQWRAVHVATRHLIELGHRRLAFLGTHPVHHRSRELCEPIRASATYDAFLSAVQSSGATVAGALGYYTTPEAAAGLAEAIRPNAYCATEEEAEQLVRRFIGQLDDKTTGFVCDADFRAVTLSHSLAAEGLQIPDDASIVGVCNTPWCEAVRPKLTSVSLDPQALARLAVQCTMLPKPAEPVVYHVGPRLVERDSTRRI